MTDTKSNDTTAVLKNIAGMEPDQEVAARMHEVITAAAPEPTEARIEDIVKGAVR